MLHKLLKSVLDQDTAPVVVCDMNDIIVYMNPSAIERYHKDLTGASIKDCHPPKANEMIEKVLAWFRESKNNNIVYTYRNEEDLYWLSRIISAESRGETLIGQIAVGNVVLNRVRSEKFADSVKDVVFEVDSGYVQFEPVSNGTIYDEPTYRSMLAAKMALAGCDIVGDSLYFFSPALSSGSWIRANRTYLTTIGCHRFYL